MNTLRTSFPRFLCIFCASILLPLLLGGCSYFDTSEHEELRVSKSVEDIEVIEEPVIAPAPITAAEAIVRNTDGRVQVFDLDGPAQQAPYYDARATAQPMPVQPLNASAPVPRVFAANPSVEIFPFEDFAPTPIAAPMQASPPPPVEQVMRHEEDYVAVEGHGGNKVIVYFGHDSTALSQAALSKVQSVASQFNQASGGGITVEGHSSVKANYDDAAQRKIVNLKISMDRAFAVARSLIQSGVPADFVRVMAWGDVRPPMQTDGKTAEDAARRVEISR